MNVKAGSEFSEKYFKNPPADCQVSYSWLWNAPVSKEIIDREIKEIVKAGVRSLYVLPLPIDFRPELTRTFMSPDYLTDEFWEVCEYAIRQMVSNGITPWLYDEGGWPSGGACGRTLKDYPEGAMNILQERTVRLENGEKYTPCKGFIALFRGKERLECDFVADCDEELTEYYGKLNTEFEDDVMRGFIDFTDINVTDAFIGNTHTHYKRTVGDLFGNTIPLIFTDEPGLKFGALPKTVFEDFIKKYGYDLRDYLYVIPERGALAKTENEIKARIDYLEYLGEQFKNATFKRLREYCDTNGIHYAGHLMGDNYPDACRCGYFSQLELLRQMAIPGVDAIWEQIRYPYGGREPYDSVETARMPFFPRLAASAARQQGNNIALTEAMGIYGDGITPEEIKYVTNYHIIRGINYISYAHIPISNERFSALATRPDFRPEKPGFYNLGHINDYFARLSYLARLGHAEGDTALYHPIRDYCANPEISERAVLSYRDAGVMLERKNIPFDIIDDSAIREADATEEGLVIGDAKYKHIVVPKNEYMPEDIRAKIAPFVGEGKPAYVFENENLIVMTRRLENGRLWFIFNEGAETVTEKFDLPGEGKIYRLDCSTSEIYEQRTAEVTLLCGDIAVFLVTDDILTACSAEEEYQKELSGFAPVSYKRLIITFDGLRNEYGTGEPIVDSGFSGEVTYRGHYELDAEPKPGERYKLTLEGFETTMSVKIADEEFSLGMKPAARIIDGALLEKRGEMEITVSNSALNEIARQSHLKKFYPKAELGPYLVRIEEFEKRIPPLRFGRVYLSKLK